ncbi:hypothetical protein AHAS_Ahas19G0048300 [Arachis hypogaea]
MRDKESAGDKHARDDKAQAETRGGREAREAWRRHKQALEQMRRRERREQPSSDGGERPDESTQRGGSGEMRGDAASMRRR